MIPYIGDEVSLIIETEGYTLAPRSGAASPPVRWYNLQPLFIPCTKRSRCWRSRTPWLRHSPWFVRIGACDDPWIRFLQAADRSFAANLARPLFHRSAFEALLRR